MKLVLEAKSLPLKAINRIVKRFLLPLIAVRALPNAVYTGMIPKISDYELLSKEGKQFEFLCPKEKYKENGQIRKRPIYKEYWFEPNEEYINFMDMQKN